MPTPAKRIRVFKTVYEGPEKRVGKPNRRTGVSDRRVVPQGTRRDELWRPVLEKDLGRTIRQDQLEKLKSAADRRIKNFAQFHGVTIEAARKNIGFVSGSYSVVTPEFGQTIWLRYHPTTNTFEWKSTRRKKASGKRRVGAKDRRLNKPEEMRIEELD